ncbi:sensor histidine kinase [Pontibacter cellulosilyticus]|uniref:Histidine kinase n=1 Tax=Pontibacter cellulosilyticus TaxID=1720253 RepID=A0A923N456_9BACT|nr:histidine kinase [Pontibacter cellulosilyticus]MBC5991529.1 histidine kinase [Pontibacter cellulosilyticus]
MNAQQKKIGLHLLGWMLYLGYTLLGYYIYNWKFNTLMLAFSQDVLRIAEFYLCYFLVFPLWLKYKNWMLLALGVAGVMLTYIALRYLIEETLYPHLFGFRNYGAGTTLSYFIFDNLYWAMPGIFLGGVVWGLETTLQKERENRSLKQEKAQAELAFLKTQINPHFLYNTLNYLYSLAYPVSDKLAVAIIRLSDLMRYMLHESKDGKVELQKEVDYLHNYLEIYRLRFEDKFFVNFYVQGHVNGQRVPALVLIPFVENALKHGVVDDASAPIEINLQLEKDSLYFDVSNRISKNQKDQTTGIGLANIRRRLDLIYPGKYKLDIQQDGLTYKTKLKLQTV